MNLAQTKVALENKVVDFLKNSLQEEVDVTANYDANNGFMTVILKENKPEEGNKKEQLLYSIIYNENEDDIAITALSRITISDEFGPSIITHNGIPVAGAFLNGVKQIIVTAMDVVYHPEKYVAAEQEEQSQPQTEVEA